MIHFCKRSFCCFTLRCNITSHSHSFGCQTTAPGWTGISKVALYKHCHNKSPNRNVKEEQEQQQICWKVIMFILFYHRLCGRTCKPAGQSPYRVKAQRARRTGKKTNTSVDTSCDQQLFDYCGVMLTVTTLSTRQVLTLGWKAALSLPLEDKNTHHTDQRVYDKTQWKHKASVEFMYQAGIYTVDST